MQNYFVKVLFYILFLKWFACTLNSIPYMHVNGTIVRISLSDRTQLMCHIFAQGWWYMVSKNYAIFKLKYLLWNMVNSLNLENLYVFIFLDY